MPPARFQPPAVRPDTLERARLNDALHTGAGRRLQIVIAPPGFGKTTLLAGFVRDIDPPPAWVTLEPGDSDLATFVSTLVQALQRPAPGFGARTLASLAGPPDIERRAIAIARAFTTEAERSFESPVILVLDDFHHVNTTAAVTAFVDEVLRRLPDNLRIVLAGRALPNLTVSRLIVAGELFGLGEADLRFTPDELHTLLRRHGAGVPPALAATLAERAEGWVAGFLLSVPDLLHRLAGGVFAGGDGELYRYLAAEAFDRQPDYLRRFLLATAVPELPDLELCRALLGEGDWVAARDAVEAAGLFLSRAGRSAFRYHQLFREFLLARLQRQDPAQARRYYAALAPALAARGEWQSAAAAYLEAGDTAAATALTAAALPELERGGRWRTITAAVAALPATAAAGRPEMLITAARAAMMTADIPRAESLAGVLRDAGERTADRRSAAWALACLGNVRRLQGRTSEARALLAQAIERAGDDEALAAVARRYLGSTLGMAGEFVAAAEHLRAALPVFDQHGMAYDAAQCEWPLGIVLSRAGHVTEAIARYRSALARWQALGDPGNAAELENCLGAAHAGRGEYAEAAGYLQSALAHAREAGAARAEGAAQHTLGEVRLSQGDAEGARAAFAQGLAVMQEAGDLWMVTQLHEGLALAALLAGSLETAAERAHHALALAERQSLPYLEARCALVLGYIQARAGQAGGRPRLESALTALAGQGAQRELAGAHLLRAALDHAAGRPWQAGMRAALAITTELDAGALLDLHARLHPSLFADASPSLLPAERLAAIIARGGSQADVGPAPLPELPAITVRAFGSGNVTINGEPVHWTWDKARELFFYLLLAGSRRLEQVAEALWPEAPPARARRDVHSALFRLRRAIHPDIVLRQESGLRLNEELIAACDVRSFERLARQAAGARGPARLEALEQAAQIADGALLDELPGVWLETERERLERMLIAVLVHLATEYTAAGQPHSSRTAAERAQALEPLNEEACAALIRACLRLGDRTAARAAYDRCASALATELGVSPGPDLTALAHRVGRGYRQ